MEDKNIISQAVDIVKTNSSNSRKILSATLAPKYYYVEADGEDFFIDNRLDRYEQPDMQAIFVRRGYTTINIMPHDSPLGAKTYIEPSKIATKKTASPFYYVNVEPANQFYIRNSEKKNEAEAEAFFVSKGYKVLTLIPHSAAIKGATYISFSNVPDIPKRKTSSNPEYEKIRNEIAVMKMPENPLWKVFKIYAALPAALSDQEKEQVFNLMVEYYQAHKTLKKFIDDYNITPTTPIRDPEDPAISVKQGRKIRIVNEIINFVKDVNSGKIDKQTFIEKVAEIVSTFESFLNENTKDLQESIDNFVNPIDRLFNPRLRLKK